MKPNPQLILALFIVIALATSCGSPPEQPASTPTVTVTTTLTATPTKTQPPPVIITYTPSSLARPSETTVPPTSVAPTGTPFDEELYLDHPLSIERLRKLDYSGSDIVIEQELAPGNNYSRYYVSYRSGELKIYALMTIPDGDVPATGWPVIVFNHGYIPPGAYQTTERYEEYVDEIAENGYIVFRPDYRGHGNSEGDARGAYGYPDYTIDVLNAVASIKKYDDADPNRIGMWGHSMGGYITLRCMVVTRDIKAASIWGGVVAPYPDLIYNWPGQTYETPEIANAWRTSLPAEYGTPAQNPSFWDAISANSYLPNISGAVQLHHATGDLEVPVEFSTKLYQRLYNVNIPVELYTYENDDHNISNSFDVAMKRTIEFFDIYVKGIPE